MNVYAPLCVPVLLSPTLRANNAGLNSEGRARIIKPDAATLTPTHNNRELFYVNLKRFHASGDIGGVI